ncbi:hypothetical protein HPB50_021017 [Hyalomma asiaticum]|uniref:Uncharacterized protein n=1 Tax=Hyalomma asiaticum TaxID=266040 RepID=A0ACB7SPY3_HYAAI|nr:hypothetical protein HPB50_021017 [Hyalomma asiaticum]
MVSWRSANSVTLPQRWGPSRARSSRVRPYKKTIPACSLCGTIGHRPSACPRPTPGRCTRYGTQVQVTPDGLAQHECNPTCLLCSGTHETGARGYPGKYRKSAPPLTPNSLHRRKRACKRLPKPSLDRLSTRWRPHRRPPLFTARRLSWHHLRTKRRTPYRNGAEPSFNRAHLHYHKTLVGALFNVFIFSSSQEGSEPDKASSTSQQEPFVTGARCKPPAGSVHPVNTYKGRSTPRTGHTGQLTGPGRLQAHLGRQGHR